MKVTKPLTLRLDCREPDQDIQMKQYGRQAYVLEIMLTDGDLRYTIPAGAVPRFACRKPDGKQTLNDCTIRDNQVIVDITEQMLMAKGNLRCEVQLYDEQTLLISATFVIHVIPSVFSPQDAQSSDEYNSLTTAFQRVDHAVSEAEQALRDADGALLDANTAKALCDAATDRANTAADLAGEKAGLAAAAAENANTKADRADASAAQADLATQNAVNATTNAITATDSANTAAERANEAAAGAIQAKEGAETATIQANEATEAANTAADWANESASHPPKIGEDGRWYVWDAENKEYKRDVMADGNTMFATFGIEPETGLLSVTMPDEYKGAEFTLNNDYLEVKV